MKQIISALFLSAILFSACQEEVMKNYLFSPEKVSISEVEKNGYERVWGVDVIMYKREFGDTTIVYQFGDEYAEYQWWRIKLNSFDEAHVKNILRYYWCHPFQTCATNPFIIHNHRNNVIMQGSINPEDSILQINYRFFLKYEPYVEEENFEIPEGTLEVEEH